MRNQKDFSIGILTQQIGSFDAAESAEMIANLRITIAQQKKDLEELQNRTQQADTDRTAEVSMGFSPRAAIDCISARYTRDSSQ